MFGLFRISAILAESFIKRREVFSRCARLNVVHGVEYETSDTLPIFTCEPSDMKLHHMNITQFKQWFGQFAAKINDAGGELHMDVPSAKSGIYLLE